MTKKRLLIIGCGDIARRAVRLMRGRYRLYALTRDPSEVNQLRALRITPIVGDLDHPITLQRLAGIADLVLHMAPPPSEGKLDRRTTNLLNALNRGRIVPRRLVYISTSGVYGNCDGQLVSETRPLNPQTARAVRRVDAEQRLRSWGHQRQASVCVLRAPGIYAAERLPLERLKAGVPALCDEDDSYTNHIHAEDLARISLIALFRGRSGRSYNATDDGHWKMGNYFDFVADHFGLPRPARIRRSAAQATLPAALLSFMGESRRLLNTRLRKELRVVLRYPSVKDGLAEIELLGGAKRTES
jgi:nucleoside-diphosphate-sugar epimerase